MNETLRFRMVLARRIAGALGVTLATLPAAYAAGCGGKVIIDEAEGGGGNGAGSSASSVSSVDSVTTGPGPTVTAVSSSAAGGCGTSSAGGVVQEKVCPSSVTSPCPSAADVLPILQQELAPCTCVLSVDKGPFPDDMMSCCYFTTVEYTCVQGRPFLVDREVVTARAESGARGWADDALAPETTPDTKKLSVEARAVLADLWSRDALLEHASIASFGRFALELLAAGAPAHLIEAAHAAAIDEVGHASAAFALASAYSGAPIGPTAFPFGGAVAISGDLTSLAVSTAIEGCIGETLAAVLAAEQLARATDPAVRRALATIAEEEARHAELAWRTVAWAMNAGGDPVRAAVADVFTQAARHVPAAPADDPSISLSILAAHGRLDQATTRSALAKGLDEIILPCARALLADARARRVESAPQPLA